MGHATLCQLFPSPPPSHKRSISNRSCNQECARNFILPGWRNGMGIGFALCLAISDVARLFLPPSPTTHPHTHTTTTHHICCLKYMLAITLVLETWYTLGDENVRAFASQPASPLLMLPHNLFAAAFFPLDHALGKSDLQGLPQAHAYRIVQSHGLRRKRRPATKTCF